MLLFLELFTAICFGLCLVHSVAIWGKEGLWFFGSLLGLGLVRENFVALCRLLYEYGSFTLQLGFAPVIGAVIWGYSIYLAVLWAVGRPSRDAKCPPRFRGALRVRVLLFMIALACFYEPFLKLQGMARWQEGTRTTLDVPWIALVGYPTLTLGFLVVWDWARRFSTPWSRARALAGLLVPLALIHAAGLQVLKSWLGW